MVLPALCRSCGCPAQFVHSELHCLGCGLREPLPRDQGALVGELQQRLFFAASSAFHVTGTVRTLANVLERGPRVGVVAWSLFALGVAVTGSVVLDSWASWCEAPVALRAGLVTSALVVPAFVLAVPFSLVVARFVGRERYRRVLRPQLLARPPRAPGYPPRCRVCSGELPRGVEALVACKYCRTESVVGAELFKARHEAPRTRSQRQVASWLKLAMTLAFAGCLATTAVALWVVYRALAS